MKPAIYHKPSNRERHIVAPNYTYGFARWLKNTTGRTLCPPHRHIIEHLERTRLNSEPVPGTPRPWQHRPYTPARVIISDPAPTAPKRRRHPAPTATDRRRHPATKASKTRINCSSITSEARHGENSASQTRASERSINFHRARTRHPFATSPTRLHAVGSGCRPAIHRGGTFDIILLLNADTYPISGPRPSQLGMYARTSAFCHPNTLDTALDTVIPMLHSHCESILIIHGTPYPRPSRRRSHHRGTPRRPSTTPSSTPCCPLSSLNSLTTLTSSSTPPRYNPTPFLHYLTASLDGDLGPFIPIDPESPPRHSQRSPSAAHRDSPSGSELSRRDSDNERTPCFSTGTSGVSNVSPGGMSYSDDIASIQRRSIIPPFIPLHYAAAAPAA
ncbi:MAG: hypothetical protein NC117_05990 [Pseudoflavonifractor sp.]|nr:hypothetical protein [Pseudoflavonifractor sp.]